MKSSVRPVSRLKRHDFLLYIMSHFGYKLILAHRALSALHSSQNCEAVRAVSRSLSAIFDQVAGKSPELNVEDALEPRL